MSALAQPTGGVAASAPSPPPPTPSAASHPPPRPHLLTPTFCTHCKAEGAANYCAGCSQSYCSKECQTMDWKKDKKLCKKLQAMRRAQPLPQQSEDGVAPGGGEGGGGGGAAAAAGGRSSKIVVDEEDEIENPCPVCLDNEDDATVDGENAGSCSTCGQSYCGACNAGGLAVRSPNCPTCRAPFNISEEEHFTRWWKLEHDRSPGRHTPAAQYHLGYRYENGKGVQQDDVEAAKWYRKSAEAGHATAQYNLGSMYDNGQGVEQDHVEAATWYRKVAEAGYANAQYNLGLMYRDGEGVEQDHVEAAKWFRKSAGAGFAPAQNSLGLMYRNGEGVEQDHVEGAKWYRKAAEVGNAMAQYNLAVMYDDGEGVDQDHVEAAKWLRKSAEAGNAEAQNNLAIMYATGEGVEEDVVKGVKWLQLAAVQGHENALEVLDMMQQHNLIPTPSTGTAVTTILLTSASAAKYNSKTGRVVEAPSPDMVRPSIAFVLLDGEAKPSMFKLMNLKVL
eukprot:gene32697-biopygen16471